MTTTQPTPNNQLEALPSGLIKEMEPLLYHSGNPRKVLPGVTQKDLISLAFKVYQAGLEKGRENFKVTAHICLIQALDKQKEKIYQGQLVDDFLRLLDEYLTQTTNDSRVCEGSN